MTGEKEPDQIEIKIYELPENYGREKNLFAAFIVTVGLLVYLGILLLTVYLFFRVGVI